jgi:hypothetical protein
LQKANLIFIFNEPIQVGPQRRNKRENYAIDIHSTRNEIKKKIKDRAALTVFTSIKRSSSTDVKTPKKKKRTSGNRVSTAVSKVSTI